ncbi:MAG: hypothetical protein ABWK00_01290 [Desulfurococcaceae archaeon]
MEHAVALPGALEALEARDELLGSVYALGDRLSVAMEAWRLAEEPELRRELEVAAWDAVNRWLEAIAPIEYVPGLAEEVSATVKRKLWESRADGSLVSKAMADAILFKGRALAGESREVLEAMAHRLAFYCARLLRWVGDSERPGTALRSWMRGVEGPREAVLRLVTILALLLVISTNI